MSWLQTVSVQLPFSCFLIVSHPDVWPPPTVSISRRCFVLSEALQTSSRSGVSFCLSFLSLRAVYNLSCFPASPSDVSLSFFLFVFVLRSPRCPLKMSRQLNLATLSVIRRVYTVLILFTQSGTRCRLRDREKNQRERLCGRETQTEAPGNYFNVF